MLAGKAGRRINRASNQGGAGNAEKADKKFAVILQHHFRDALAQAATRRGGVIDGGEFGALVSACRRPIRWWRTPVYLRSTGRRHVKARDGGGVLITQAIHTLDLFPGLARPIAKCRRYTRT